MEESRIIKIDTPKPHSRKQALVMSSFMLPYLTEIYICCGTKWGKSVSMSSCMINGMVNNPSGLWRWVAPIYEQTKIGYDYCKGMLPPAPLVNAVDGKLEITITSSNTRLKFHHAQDPVSLEGAAVKGYGFDEAAKMKEDVYASAKTTRTVTRGPMAFFSTPYGKNWFYRKCMEAKEEMKRAKFEKRNPTKLFIRAPTSDNPFVPRQSIEEARRELPARLFQQYYEAEFIDDGSVFIGYRECMEGLFMDMFGEIQTWTAQDCETKSVFIGVDWAKMTDWTVFIAATMEFGICKVVGFERFHRRAYTEGIKRLMTFGKKFKQVEIIFHDKTGVGEAIDEQLSYTGFNYRGVTFTNHLKNEMVAQLMTAFEQSRIILPRWNTLLTELETFEVKTTNSGNMTYGAPSGFHDDTVCSLMLAHQAALQYGETSVEVRFLEDLPSTISSEPTSIEQYYKTIADDDDD